MRLLLVEINAPSGGDLVRALRQGGHLVDAFRDFDEAVLALRMVEYDLLLLDLDQAIGKVQSLLRSLRARNDQTPLLVMSSLGSVVERAQMLDRGVDDYIVKPYELPELLARIRAILRRALAKSGDNVIGIGKLRFSLVQRSISVDGARLKLSPREVDVLETLVMRRGQVVSKAQIRWHLCEWNEYLSDGAIELYVHRLRRRLVGSDAQVRTVRGFGYVLQ
jgi:DNA-binding response OmpR family regulator